MKEASKVTKKGEEKFSMGKDVKADNRGRDVVFEVQHNSVSVDWSANYVEALGVHRALLGSKLYEINMTTGKKTLRAI